MQNIMVSRKNHILQFMQKTGTWCSGQDIADQLGISRAAIAKHVNALRADGHVIDSAPKRGYRLVVATDTLDSDLVAPHLMTHSFGRTEWLFLPTTSSTSNELTALALQGAPEGTVVAAETQTEGKGSKGHTWFSAPRALQFSVLARPGAEAKVRNHLLRAATVAVAEALSQLYPLAVRVKHPNDILVNKRKVAGVLIESGYRNHDLEWVVIGIGCNVNTLVEEFPSELHDKVTSLYAESSRWISRNVVLATILNTLEQWYDRVNGGDTKLLETAWAQLHG